MAGPPDPAPDERIFISYRRSDSQAETRMLQRALEGHLGPIVFQDLAGIEIGERIPDELDDQLERCDVVLAVIGPDWLTTANEYGQRRIDLDDDWVRRELTAALSKPDTLTIPVLVDGASLPPAEALPEPLRGLGEHRAIKLVTDMWDKSVEVLAERLRDHLELPDPPADDETDDETPGSSEPGDGRGRDPDGGADDRADHRADDGADDQRFNVVTLRFDAASDGRYPITLTSSTADEPVATATTPLDTDGLRRRLAESTAPVVETVRRAADDGASLPTLEAARELGIELHAGLAPNAFWEAYRTTQDTAGFRHANGVRFVIDATEAPDVAQLPWELLVDPVDDGFVVLNPMTPVIRTLEVRAPASLGPVTAPLRLLVAAAQPSGTPELAIGEELAQLDRALRTVSDEGALEIKRLDPVTVDRLMEELDDFEPHIVHFIGHGGTSDADGFIMIEDDDGSARRLTGDQLGVLLNSFEEAQPRLIFLNSCLGAAQSERDSFGGMAQTLLRRGVPAVIAMQYPIPDASAVGLAEWFYRRLARGRPVEVALSAGRSLLYARDNTVVDWAAPALYKRSPETPLFDLDRSNLPRPAAAAAAPAPAPPSTAPAAMTPTPASSGPLLLGRTLGGRRWLVLAVVAALLLVATIVVLGRGTNDEGGTDGVDSADTTEPPATQTTATDTTAPTTSSTSTSTSTSTTTTTAATSTTVDATEATLVFESGSAELSAEATQALDQLASQLEADPALDVTVLGYSDPSGPAGANQALSEARADAAVAYLTEQGIEGDRLDAVGLGERIESDDPEAGRRVEFTTEATTGHEVVAGDTLWGLAERYAGSGERWPELFGANADRIADPDLILVGQVLRIPPLS